MNHKIKILGMVFCALLLTQSISLASFKLPSIVYSLSELEEAKAKAVKSQKPIAFIYTNCESNCGLCEQASLLMVSKLRSKTVMVYLPSDQKKPAFTKQAFSRGRYIPKLAVFDLELNTVIGEVIYEDIESESEDAFDDLLDSIKDYRKSIKGK